MERHHSFAHVDQRLQRPGCGVALWSTRPDRQGERHLPAHRRAAGLTYGHRKWVICSYTAGSTIIDAVINLPSTISPDKAMSNLKTNIGTVAKAGTFLSQNAHVQTDYSSYGPHTRRRPTTRSW